MSDKIEPIIHKLTEAVPPPAEEAKETHEKPQDNLPPDMKEHNAEVQPTRDERLVGIGRGHHTTGRGGYI